MRAGLGVSVDQDDTSLDISRPDAHLVNRGGAVHAYSLRDVDIELVALDHPHTVVAPVDRAWSGRFLVVIVVIVTVRVLVAHGGLSVGAAGRILSPRSQATGGGQRFRALPVLDDRGADPGSARPTPHGLNLSTVDDHSKKPL